MQRFPGFPGRVILRAAGVVVVLLLGGALRANDDADNIWFKHFYQTQDVARFDAYWNRVLAERWLSQRNVTPPLIGFVSQVVHRSPALIKGRLDQPREFPGEQKDAILQMLWLSDTPEARAVLVAAGEADLANTPPPPIATRVIRSGGDLDVCWGWFFATGDRAALVPIIRTLDYVTAVGALDRYRSGPKTPETKAAAMQEVLFRAAAWSLSANSRENPDVLQALQAAVKDPQAPHVRQVGLAQLIANASAPAAKPAPASTPPDGR